MCNCPLASALYCARGKADEAVLEAGCNCSFCSVADKYDLTLEYHLCAGKIS
ncbi:DUF2769 domain-containing protein [Candidatus Bathyarchaeota archaeon A05DMB-2]|nr:DUF2769 domain-containing protein [Candidatus Bathyarchaeota archaeon A05DMB-2]